MAFSFNSQISSMTTNLIKLGTQLEMSNTRLSTGKKINKASDDPSGLIAATMLNKEINALDAKISSAERMNAVIDTADGALSEINSLLTEIDSAIIASTGITATDAEKAAYQAQIDDAIDQIDKLASTTSFNGTKLLDGSTGYDVSGATSSEITDIRVHRASSATGASISVTKSRTETQATLEIMDAAPTGNIEFTVTGEDGTSTTLNFNGTHTLNDIETAIDAQTGSTGVEATVSGGSLYLLSTDSGRNEFATVTVTDGASDFTITGSSATAYGTTTDTVTANGVSLTQDVEGSYTYSDSSTTVEFNLVDSFTGTTSFAVSGSGANWSLNGEELNFGINSMSSSTLGNVNVGYLSSLKSGGANSISSGNAATAQSIIDEAQGQALTEQGYLGGISKYTIDSSINSWESSKSALSESLSLIQDIDYAEESANNSRLQILYQTQASVISSMLDMSSKNMSTLLNL